MIFDTGDDDMRYFHLCIHCKGNISAKISTQISHTFCQQTIFYLNNVSKQQIWYYQTKYIWFKTTIWAYLEKHSLKKNSMKICKVR